MNSTDGNLRFFDSEASVPSSQVVFGPVPEGFTELQSRFIDAFIELGGRAAEAAELAGYAGGARNMALRNLAQTKIQEEIVRRLKMRNGSALATAIGRLLQIVETSKDEKTAAYAAVALMDRFGMAPPKGPLVAMQVNNNFGGEQVQGILAEVAAARQQRLRQQADQRTIEHKP